MSGFFQHLSELLGRHPFDDAFIETMRERIREHCSRVPVHVHKRQVAEARLELAAKEAIVSVFQDEFPNAIRPHTVRPDWPYAECWITDDEALIRFSFSPETDSIMGGHTLEPVRIVVQRAPPGLMKRLADSMLKHHLIDENSLHGLKENARLYLGAPDYDLTSKEKRNMRSVPPARLFLYNALDTHYTLGLDAVYNGQLPEESRRLYDRLVMRAARAFEVIENRGFHVNLERFAKASTVLKRRRAKLLRQLQNSVGYEVNWNSPTQVARVLYEDLGMPVMVTTDKGAPSTGEEALVDMEHPIVDLLKKYREIDKLVSTYIDGWSSMMVGSTLYLGFKLAGTVTGRYASRLHQIPRDPMIRSLIDAEDGWVFVAADYSQIELRIVAELAGEPRMLQIYQTNGDIHRMTAQSVLGIEEPSKEERKSAKAVNFGFVYGMMAAKFRLYAKVQYGVHLSESEAQEYRDGFFGLYGGLLKWHERMRKLVRMDGQVRNRAGRIRHLPMVNSSEREARNEAERQAINTVVQGFGGDLKAMALVELHETLPEDEFRVFGEHHDAILMAVRNDCLDKHLPSIRKIMQHPSLMDEFGINLRVPILVDIEVGPWSLGEKWNGD